jgi:hypothetical protein
MCNNQGLCLYLLMGFNDLGLLVKTDGAISIITILLVDVKVESLPPYIYVPTLQAKRTKTTVRGASSLENHSCSKLYFSPPSLVAVCWSVVIPACFPPAGQDPSLLIGMAWRSSRHAQG